MKQRIFIVLLLPLLLLSACSKSSNTLENLSDMELAADQTLVTGQVVSRVGNDLELAVGTLSQGQGSLGAMPSDGAVPSGGGSAPDGDAGPMPSGGHGNGGDFSGQRPDRGDSSGQAAGGGSQDFSQGMAQDGTTDGAAAEAAGSQIQLSGEGLSLTIPVGTRVLVTSNGTLIASSFGRIQTDDILQLLLTAQPGGTQVVTLVQIME